MTKHQAPKTYLGFDFGTRQIGVAIGQTLTRTARGLASVSANKGEPDWAAIDALLKEWEPDGLVVGIPLNMDGSEQKVTHQARMFANKLQMRYGLPLYEADERLTTAAAKSNIFEELGFRGLTKSAIDEQSAVLILTSWLEEHMETGNE